MSAELDAICADLAAEQEELDAVLAALEESDWNLDTPAVGWTIRDQVGHMAFSEDMATLAIIDPENRDADQPFVDPSGRYVVVFNGEIFNFWELRRELEGRGVRFRTASDSEVTFR